MAKGVECRMERKREREGRGGSAKRGRMRYFFVNNNKTSKANVVPLPPPSLFHSPLFIHTTHTQIHTHRHVWINIPSISPPVRSTLDEEGGPDEDSLDFFFPFPIL